MLNYVPCVANNIYLIAQNIQESQIIGDESSYMLQKQEKFVWMEIKVCPGKE